MTIAQNNGAEQVLTAHVENHIAWVVDSALSGWDKRQEWLKQRLDPSDPNHDLADSILTELHPDGVWEVETWIDYQTNADAGVIVPGAAERELDAIAAAFDAHGIRYAWNENKYGKFLQVELEQ